MAYVMNMDLCALYDKNKTIYVHYVKWLLCESKWINNTSIPTMLADKDLVVIIWLLKPGYANGQGLSDHIVLQWLKQYLGPRQDRW